MKFLYTIAFLILCSVAIVTGQAKYKCCSTITVSQSSNEYIYHSSRNQVFISSIDGLNIFDGQESKTYRSATHRMNGNSMSSNFFEDADGKVWFTTNEALHYYNPFTDSLDYLFLVSATGDTIKSNYGAFFLSGNDLYLTADSTIFKYDLNKRSILASYNIALGQYNQITILESNNKTLLCKSGRTGYKVYSLDVGNQVTLMYSGEASTRDVYKRQASCLFLFTFTPRSP